MTSDPGPATPDASAPSPSVPGPSEPAPSVWAPSAWTRPAAQPRWDGQPRWDDEPTARLPQLADSPAGSPPVPLPPREGLRGTLVVLGLTVAMLLGVGGLAWLATARSTTPVAAGPAPVPVQTPTPTPSVVPVTPRPGAIYQVPEDLCQQADFTALRPTFDQIGELTPQRDSSAGFFQFAQCEGSTGNETVQGRFSFRMTVYAEATVARTEFEAARTGAQGHGKVTGVPDAGEAAYEYVEPTVGPTVEIYDGNLRIRLSWAPSDTKAKAPDGTATALIDVCESTMRLLRDN